MCIRDRVKGLFRAPLNKGFNPDEVVAIGAAIQGGILEGEIKAVTLLDVTAFSLGIETEGRRFARLIAKNSTIPAQKTQLVSTVVENQRSVKIHVLQGESQDARENVSLGEFELTNIQPAPRGAPRIQVKFSIDANGIVNVSARDMRTGVSDQITIETPAGLNDQDIQRLRQEADEHYQQEREAGETKELKNQVERQIVALESFLRDRRGALHRNDIFEVEQALRRGRMALLKSTDRSNLENMLLYLTGFHAHLEDKIASDASMH